MASPRAALRGGVRPSSVPMISSSPCSASWVTPDNRDTGALPWLDVTCAWHLGRQAPLTTVSLPFRLSCHARVHLDSLVALSIDDVKGSLRALPLQLFLSFTRGTGCPCETGRAFVNFISITVNQHCHIQKEDSCIQHTINLTCDLSLYKQSRKTEM